MNCPICDIEYRDDVPHPPSVCAEHAGAEMRKARKALDGALETISKKDKEIEDTKALVRQVVRLEGKSWYSLAAERVPALALVEWSDSRYVKRKSNEQCPSALEDPKKTPPRLQCSKFSGHNGLHEAAGTRWAAP